MMRVIREKQARWMNYVKHEHLIITHLKIIIIKQQKNVGYIVVAIIHNT